MAAILLNVAISIAVSTAIAYLFPQEVQQEGQRLDDLGVVGSRYGAAIPLVHGRDRVPGNIVWAEKLREVKTTEEISAGKGSTITQTSYAYFATFAALLCEGANEMRPLRIWGDKKLLWEAPDTSLYLAGDLSGGGSFEFMPGGPDQLPSAVMEASLGAADTPAYRGRCCLVISDLPVEQFGRRPPAIEVEVARGPATVAAVVSDVLSELCLRAGLSSGEIDVSAITQEVHGIRLSPASAASTIETILNGLGLQVIGAGSELQFLPIEQTVGAEITEGELLAGQSARFPIRRLREDALPRSVTVRHFDPARDYQIGAQQQRRQSTRSVQAVTLDAPMSLSASQASAAVDSLLYRAWTARTQFGPFGLPQRYLAVLPGSVLGITVDGRRHQVRLRKVTIGANGALQCEGEAYDVSVLTGVSSGNSGTFSGQQLPVYGDTTLRLLDVPAITDAEAAQVGYRLAATGSGASWRTGVLEVSVDSGVTWSTVAVLPAYTVMGFAGTVLPDPPVHIGAASIDAVSTVEVSLIKGTLSSVSDDLLVAGANRAVIGGEVIQFGEATLIGPLTYRLGRFLRGRRGTEAAMAGHVVDEAFTLLSGSVFIPASAADLGVSRQYRITPPGGTASTPQAFSITGASARPFSAVDVRGARAGSDLTITWVRRSRIGTELPDSGDIPLDEPTERYEVDILNGGTVVRTIAVTAPTASYTAAEQTTDFGSPQATVSVRVYQLGQLVGRGTVAAATV